MILITTWFGTFLCEDKEVVNYKLFPKNAVELATRMLVVENKKVLREERELIKGLENFYVSEPRLEKLGGISSSKEIFIEPKDYDFNEELLHGAMIEIAKTKTQEAIGEDKHIVQAVNAIDELIQTANLLSERLHEWYGLHFPELTRLVAEEKFVDLIGKYGDRDAIKQYGKVKFSDSIGAALSNEDKKAIMDLAKILQATYESKAELEKHIAQKMGEVAPNTSHIVGPIIGARLIALAGGLNKIARMPSSTIQLLGAEKALFRHLKDGSRPPKHGVLFQHPLVHRAPYWHRGKIARAFASKLSIAAKIDFYDDRFIAEQLEQDLLKRIEDIRKKYPKAPKKKKKDYRKKERPLKKRRKRR